MTPDDTALPTPPRGVPPGRLRLIRLTLFVAWTVTVTAWRYRMPGAWGPVRLAWRNVAWVTWMGRLPVPSGQDADRFA